MPEALSLAAPKSVDDNLVVGRQVGGSNALAQTRISQDTTNFAQKRCNNVKRTGNIGRIEFPRTEGARRQHAEHRGSRSGKDLHADLVTGTVGTGCFRSPAKTYEIVEFR